MSSWLVSWFMEQKVNVTLDEVRRHRRTHLILTDHDLLTLENKIMEKMYHSKVNHLLLNRNQLDIQSFPRDFGFFAQKLVSLSLAENKLRDIPSSLGLLKSLKGLNISNNPLTCQELPVVLCELKQLQCLYANHTSVSRIPEDLYFLQELQVLGLRHNAIRVIPPIIFRLPKLQWLTLAHNRIVEVPPEVVEAKSLVHFNLNFNRVSRIPSNTWDQMRNLRYLFLKSNKLELNEVRVIDMQKIPKLQKIDLSSNIMNFQQNPPIKDKLIVTRETQFSPIEIEAEDIWRRGSSGLINHSSSTFEFSGKASTIYKCDLKRLEKDAGNLVSSTKLKVTKPHSEPGVRNSKETVQRRWRSESHFRAGTGNKFQAQSLPGPTNLTYGYSDLIDDNESAYSGLHALQVENVLQNDTNHTIAVEAIAPRRPRDLTTHASLLNCQIPRFQQSHQYCERLQVTDLPAVNTETNESRRAFTEEQNRDISAQEENVGEVQLDNGFVPVDNGPVDNGFVPVDNGFVPVDNGFVPVDNGFVPVDNGFVPVDNGFVPVDNGFVPVDNGLVDNGVVDNGLPNIPPELEPDEADAGIDDENSDWESSISTADLDDCDLESDFSEDEEMLFEEPEARFTLYSILF